MLVGYADESALLQLTEKNSNGIIVYNKCNITVIIFLFTIVTDEVEKVANVVYNESAE